jgi:hypothetical protein
MKVKILSRRSALHLPALSPFHGKGTRRDQKQRGRVSSPMSAPRLPCRSILPRCGLHVLGPRYATSARPSTQPRLSVQHRHRSPAHKCVSRRNEPRAGVVAPCLRLFSESSDECAAALPYETSPCLLNGLSYLATNLLSRIANTFAFIRLRRIKAADIGSNLSD